MLRWLNENIWADVDFHPPARERRKAGLMLLVGSTVFGSFVAWKSGEGTHSDWARTIWALGATLGLGALAPVVGRRVFAGMLRATCLIGFVINHVALGLVFVLIFTPASLILRIGGKDLLDRRGFGRKDAGRTAWKAHKPMPPKRQYHHLS